MYLLEGELSDKIQYQHPMVLEDREEFIRRQDMRYEDLADQLRNLKKAFGKK